MHGWWWHLFHDPMRDNPWSLVALILALATIGALLWSQPWRMLRRRKPMIVRSDAGHHGALTMFAERDTLAVENPAPRRGFSHFPVTDSDCRRPPTTPYLDPRARPAWGGERACARQRPVPARRAYRAATRLAPMCGPGLPLPAPRTRPAVPRPRRRDARRPGPRHSRPGRVPADHPELRLP